MTESGYSGQYKLLCQRPLPDGSSRPPVNINLACVQSEVSERPAVNPEHDFESFIVYPSNRLAALALESFSRGYESLPAKIIFLSAGGAWGKSHLLDAAARRLAQSEHVLKLSADDPAGKQWGKAEVIVADDIHLLEQRPEIQNKLIQAFDETLSRRLRIIASGPGSPYKLPNLSDQLRSRLASGLHLRIDPPEFELMMDLAGRKARIAGLEINQDRRSALAKAAQRDPRRLSGFIDSASFIFTNTDLNLQDSLDAVIQDKSPEEAPVVPTVPFIIETVASSFALKPHDLTGHSKLRQTAWPRRTAIYLTRELTGLTTSDIGKAFGGRDHSTVIHALKKINEEIKNPAKARIVENIRRAILMGAKEAPVNLNPVRH